MILPEDRFIALFDTLPSIINDGNEYKPQYDFGTIEDLNRFLNQKRKEVALIGGNIYPLIWLETPIKKTGTDKRVTFKPVIVLGTLTNSTISNRERLEVTFKPVLIPLLENVLKSLKQSGFTTIVKKKFLHEYDRTDFFNYVTDEEHEATDIWDAMKIELEIEMTDNCQQKNINY